MIGNKTVLITGSSRGIGKAIATAFAIEGYNVAITCKTSVNELKMTYNELLNFTPGVLAISGDLSDYSTAKNTIDNIINEFGNIDILINNAGVSYVGPFNEMMPHQWKSVMDNNLTTVFNCTHLAIKNMIKEKKGNIINISSMWGNMGASCEAVYSASKGAINSFTKSMAKELAPSKIRVNAIACGAIDTEMNNFLSVEEKYDFMHQIPLGRFGTPDEVAKLALYLAESDSDYITGQIFNIDGGMS